MTRKTTRTTQHKPSRDDRKKDETEELRAQVRSLRKQLKQQRKLATRVPIVEVDQAEAIPYGSKDPVQACVECGSPSLKFVTLPTGTKLQICTQCHKRVKK